ncbi:MAG TPA: RNA polymerase sigma factor SigZ [Chloroflexota bacterium]|jgi:RNA polymerase sigma-70 factor (ECF subfamily)
MTITTEGIWQELHTSLRGFIARRVPAEDVDDVLQDVFVRIHRRLATLAQQEQVQAWVYQITRNVIIDYYRLRARLVREAPDAVRIEPLVEWPEDDDPHTTAVRSELATCLGPLVQRLPDTYREAVMLADFRGQSQRVVAEHLGISVSGVKSRVQRGRARLRTLLQVCCDLELDHRGSVVGCQAPGANCCQAGHGHEPREPVC